MPAPTTMNMLRAKMGTILSDKNIVIWSFPKIYMRLIMMTVNPTIMAIDGSRRLPGLLSFMPAHAKIPPKTIKYSPKIQAHIFGFLFEK